MDPPRLRAAATLAAPLGSATIFASRNSHRTAAAIARSSTVTISSTRACTWAKVTGKFQITLPKALVDQCGIRVGDELVLRPIGRSIQIDRRTTRDASHLRGDRLAHFDRATTRQRARERTRSLVQTRSRGWTREELYVRGRAR